jgi:molecular chaperone GrpE
MTNFKEMLKMSKKKSSKETISEIADLLKKEETTLTDKQTQEEPEETSAPENNPKEKHEPQKEEIKELTLEEKYEELNDKFIRLHAEFDNYRKRTCRERIDLCNTASEDVIKLMLPIIDDFERAIKSIESGDEICIVNEGVMCIYNKFINILKNRGIEEIKSSGEIFNTDFHEAITNIPTEDEELKGKVVDVVEKGYMLNGKVIRFAKVVVGN